MGPLGESKRRESAVPIVFLVFDNQRGGDQDTGGKAKSIRADRALVKRSMKKPTTIDAGLCVHDDFAAFFTEISIFNARSSPHITGTLAP